MVPKESGFNQSKTSCTMCAPTNFWGFTSPQIYHGHYMLGTCVKRLQRLYVLRCLKKFRMKPEILVNFYRSIIESILTGSIMVWFGNMTDADRNSLSRVIRTARRLTGVDLPDLREIFYCRVKSRIHKVIADPMQSSCFHIFRTPPLRETIPKPGPQWNEL